MDKSAAPRRHSFAAYISGIVAALAMSAACMSLVVGIVLAAPAAMPFVWVGVPLGTFLGMVVVHRRLPEDSYVIGLVFVPVVAALLSLAAFQVAWTVGRNTL